MSTSASGGHTRTILTLHGMSLNPSIFPEFGPVTLKPDLTKMADRLQTVPALPGPVMGGFVGALDDYLEHQESWHGPRRIVVGHSFGGMLALAWWLSHGGKGPARVDHMILVSTSPGPLFDSLSLAPVSWSPIRIPLKQVMRFWNLTPVTAAAKLLLSGSLASHAVDFQELTERSDFAVDLAGWRNTPWRAMRHFRNALAGFDVREELDRVKVDVTVVHGLNDPLIPPGVAVRLATWLPRAALYLVPGAAHALPLTHGSLLGKLVRA